MSLNNRDPLVVGGVIGDVLEQFTRSIDLRVTYGQREVTNGLDIRPSQILNKPRVEIGGDDLRNFYTLVLTFKLSVSYFFITLLLSCNLPWPRWHTKRPLVKSFSCSVLLRFIGFTSRYTIAVSIMLFYLLPWRWTHEHISPNAKVNVNSFIFYQTSLLSWSLF